MPQPTTQKSRVSNVSSKVWKKQRKCNPLGMEDTQAKARRLRKTQILSLSSSVLISAGGWGDVGMGIVTRHL
jgi:hypothetical protein